MPLGDFIDESLLREVLRWVLGWLSYYTGAAALYVLSLGQLRLAPFHTFDDTNRYKTQWNDWSPWLYRSGLRRELKASWVCFVGVLVWIAAVCLVGVLRSHNKQPSAHNKAGISERTTQPATR
jgi:hypothetical protein